MLLIIIWSDVDEIQPDSYSNSDDEPREEGSHGGTKASNLPDMAEK